jgi:hypothetical protein
MTSMQQSATCNATAANPRIYPALHTNASRSHLMDHNTLPIRRSMKLAIVQFTLALICLLSAIVAIHAAMVTGEQVVTLTVLFGISAFGAANFFIDGVFTLRKVRG